MTCSNGCEMLSDPRFSIRNPIRTYTKAIDWEIEPLINVISDLLEPRDLNVDELATASGLPGSLILRGLHRLQRFHEVEQHTREGEGPEIDRRVWRLNVRGVWVQSWRATQGLSLYPPSRRRPVVLAVGAPKKLPADW